MVTRSTSKFATFAATVGAAALVLAGCSTNDPLDADPTDIIPGGPGGTIVVGSQSYYSNEIIAEIYAQALENAGYTVTRQFNIGQRDAYIPSLENGEIDVFPEYTGNLLQFFEPDTTARTQDDVYDALPSALPDGLVVLSQSPASDQDSYTVTADFAAEHNLVTIADLANVDVPLTLGGPPELEDRPYGPSGILDVYGVEVGFSATGDTTVEDLVAGTVNLANVYTADPRIQTSDLVVLEDPEGLFLASYVVPVVSADLENEISAILDAVSEALTPEGLVELNVMSTVDQLAPDVIARQWLEARDLV